MPEDPGRAERDEDAAGSEETSSTLRQRSVHALEAGSSATAPGWKKYTVAGQQTIDIATRVCGTNIRRGPSIFAYSMYALLRMRSSSQYFR